MRESLLNVILISYLKEFGGMSVVNKTAYDVIRKIGPTILATVSKCNNKMSLLPLRINAFAKMQSLLSKLTLKKVIHSFKKINILWTDHPFYFKNERINYIIEYIHFPEEALPKLQEYYVLQYRGLRSFYYKVYKTLYRVFARKNPFETADVVFANSKFTAKYVKELWNNTPHVLYPPVDIDYFSSFSKDKREDIIISVGRISPEKRHDIIIKALSKSKNKRKLIIVGGLIRSKYSYYEYLKEIARKYNVKVEFKINIKKEELARILGTAKYYIHATRNEHFGISVVEALAAGCTVIVHKSGGPWEDIVEKGKYGYGFEDEDELAEILSTDIGPKKHSNLAKFSKESFQKQLLKFLKRL